MSNTDKLEFELLEIALLHSAATSIKGARVLALKRLHALYGTLTPEQQREAEKEINTVLKGDDQEAFYLHESLKGDLTGTNEAQK